MLNRKAEQTFFLLNLKGFLFFSLYPLFWGGKNKTSLYFEVQLCLFVCVLLLAIHLKLFTALNAAREILAC